MSPDLFNYYSEIKMSYLRDMEGVKVGGTNINNIRYAEDTVLPAESHDKVQDLVNTLNRSNVISKGLKSLFTNYLFYKTKANILMKLL